MIDAVETGIELRQSALAKLTHILYVYYEKEDDKIRQARVAWPTFMGVIETEDPIHRSFLFGKLEEFRYFTSECSRLYRIAEEVLRLQDGLSSPRVDLADYMKSP
jgi:hypothetical protein